MADKTADLIFQYLKDTIYSPDEARLDIEDLPESFADVGKGLLYLNRMINETRELSKELAAGNLNCDVPPPDNEIAAPLKMLHASLKHLTWQTQTVAKGNYNQRVDFMGEFSAAFNEMITQLQRRETENLDEKGRLKDFLAKMSHEIRTPLNAVIGMSELALREEMSDPAREYAVGIKQAGGLLLDIISDILDFSKIESGHFELNEESYLLTTMVNDVINIIKMRARDSGLDFFSDIELSLPNLLYGDSLRIHQILINLLTNAVKYTDEGYVSFTVSGVVRDDEVVLSFSVQDSGKGISEKNLKALFEEFSRFDAKANKNIEGTGLGLAITKGLVTAMGGDIDVQSKYGAGSTFTVTLPQKIRGSATVADEAINEDAELPTMQHFIAPSAHVLIVDDVKTNLIVAEGLMRTYKIKIDSATSGMEAIKIANLHRYDIIFLDHMMPDMDGIEAVSHLRQRGNHDVPIIALTANVISGAREMFLAGGFDDFLSKPIDVYELDKLLNKWIPQSKKFKEEPNEVNINTSITMPEDEHYLEILTVFRHEATKKIDELRDCLARGDIKNYTTYVHGLKSALAGVGAMELSNTAEMLEDAGREMNLPFIQKENPEFIIKLGELVTNIKEKLNTPVDEGKSSQKNKKPGISKKTKKILAELKIAMENYDTSEINKLCKALDAAEPENPIIAEILTYKLIGDYDEAMRVINEVS